MIGLGGVFLGMLILALATVGKQADIQAQAWRAGYEAAMKKRLSHEPD